MFSKSVCAVALVCGLTAFAETWDVVVVGGGTAGAGGAGVNGGNCSHWSWTDAMGLGTHGGGGGKDQDGRGSGVVYANVSGTLTIDGEITADYYVDNPFCGSGGSIQLHAGSYAGKGFVTANGAKGTSSDSADGGRIALYVGGGGGEFAGTVTAYGGGPDATRPGACGTVYRCREGELGHLLLDAEGRKYVKVTPLADFVFGGSDFRLASLTVTNGASAVSFPYAGGDRGAGWTLTMTSDATITTSGTSWMGFLAIAAGKTLTFSTGADQDLWVTNGIGGAGNVAFAANAKADAISWNGDVAGGNWSESANWAADHTPLAQETIYITNTVAASGHVVTADVSYVSTATNALVVGNATGTATNTLVVKAGTELDFDRKIEAGNRWDVQVKKGARIVMEDGSILRRRYGNYGEYNSIQSYSHYFIRLWEGGRFEQEGGYIGITDNARQGIRPAGTSRHADQGRTVAHVPRVPFRRHGAGLLVMTIDRLDALGNAQSVAQEHRSSADNGKGLPNAEIGQVIHNDICNPTLHLKVSFIHLISSRTPSSIDVHLKSGNSVVNRASEPVYSLAIPSAKMRTGTLEPVSSLTSSASSLRRYGRPPQML